MDEGPIKSPDDIQWGEMEGHRIPGMCKDDASRWASAFCYYAKKNGHDLDEGWMASWFANAIETSWDARVERSSPPTKPNIADHLTVVK